MPGDSTGVGHPKGLAKPRRSLGFCRHSRQVWEGTHIGELNACPAGPSIGERDTNGRAGHPCVVLHRRRNTFVRILPDASSPVKD